MRMLKILHVSPPAGHHIAWGGERQCICVWIYIWVWNQLCDISDYIHFDCHILTEVGRNLRFHLENVRACKGGYQIPHTCTLSITSSSVVTAAKHL